LARVVQVQLLVLAQTTGTTEAAAIARRLGTGVLDPTRTPPDGVHFAVTGERRELQEFQDGRVVTRLHVDLRKVRDSPTLRRAVLASGSDQRQIVDATGGLGNDAFVMARAGAQVHVIERSPVVHLLLEDGLRRALLEPATQAAASRMKLYLGEARDLLPRFSRCDVVYLDPMYPVSGREGGKTKGMRLLRIIAGGDDDADELLKVARAVAARRVTVKRRLRAPLLGGEQPSGSLKGKTVRFDLYAPGPDAGEE